MSSVLRGLSQHASGLRYTGSVTSSMRRYATKPKRPVPPPPPIPTPSPGSKILGYLRHSPWSSQFPGSWKARAAAQAMIYAVGIVLATNYLDSYIFPDGKKRGYATAREVQVAIEKLKAAFPDEGRVSTDPEDLKVHGSSENSYHPASPHSVVVRPLSTEDVVTIVKIANECVMPMVVYSGATSLEGHYSGVPTGSICIDMSGMDKILSINEPDSDLICQSGARWEDINQTLKDKGIPLFFPLDPGPGATIGGMVGTGCSGTNAVRYGTAKAEWFLNLTVVLPNGEVIKTRRRARKSAAGFDLTKLFIGAEGTLGIVTEATLRLAPRLPTKVAMAQFPNVEKAVSAVQEILNSPYGAHFQCVELLDDHMMAAINNGGLVDHPYPVKDTLFFKIQGDDAAIQLASKTVKTIVNKHGSLKFEFAKTDQEAEDLWQNRNVPVSRLPELVYDTKRDLAEAGLKSTIVGHVGDGNFHALILFKDKDEEELKAVEAAVHRLVHRAVALDGTCTGEHGVGVGKTEYLVEELGEGTVELMKTIKKTVDPLGLMNPGKTQLMAGSSLYNQSSTIERIFRATISTSEHNTVSQYLIDAESELKRHEIEIDKLRSTIVLLENKMGVLSRKIVKYRSLLSPVHRMPPEILRNVFSFVCHETVFRLDCTRSPPPLLLSAICGRWREIALATPSLWSCMHIDLVSDWVRSGRFSHFSYIIQLFLERSRNSPLDLTLDFRYQVPQADLIPVIATLVSHSNRWHRLKLIRMFQDWFRHAVFAPLEQQGLPILEHLQHSCLIEDPTERDDYVCQLFAHCPSLISLKMAGSSALGNLPWEQILALEMSNSYIFALDIVALCKNVDRLTMRYAGDEAFQGNHIAHSIQRLSIMASTEADVTTVLKNSTLRELSSLEIRGSPGESLRAAWDTTQNVMTDFLQRSSCNLTSLTLARLPISDNHTLDLLRLLPTLNTLHIEERRSNPSNGIITAKFLERISDVARMDIAPFLPELSNVKFVLHAEGLDVESLSRALTSRWVPDSEYASQLGISCIQSVEIMFVKGGEHLENLRSSLGWMTRAGAQLTIGIANKF
ncbi:D-lactate ferricytochrome c oxidoreductase [Paramarasmius palmivorus]|uniref:D-lactate dehydrogenase (cytochrome) n=1 Tax=Paramarasmius palmivorus TaxID=297713 RepID=A0AAW0DEB2_9AGAR